MNEVPPRSDWPPAPKLSDAGDALTELILETFRLNARLLEVAQERAAAGGLTAAWWQVLGGVIDEPRSVADVGRKMGVTRQAVQRIADLLVERGLAEYRINPAHRRAKLLACTEAGYWAIRRISVEQRPWADEVGAQIGTEALQQARATMRALVETIDEGPAQGPSNAAGTTAIPSSRR